MPPYISVRRSKSRGQLRLLVNIGRNFWFVLTERGMAKAGALFHDMGETEWNFDVSVFAYRKMDIKSLIQKGYEQAKEGRSCETSTTPLSNSVARN